MTRRPSRGGLPVRACLPRFAWRKQARTQTGSYAAGQPGVGARPVVEVRLLPRYFFSVASIPNFHFPLLLILIAFGLRVYELDFQPLWWDEGYSVFFASQPVTELLKATAADIHPPLYYLMLRGWSGVVGFIAWNIRFPSVMAGTLCVAVLYVLGRRLASWRVGLIAAGILTLSPFQIHHAQEARMYPLVTLLALLSTYMLAHALSDGSIRSSKGYWIGYTLTIVLALLTHYYAVFIPLFQGAYVLLQRREAAAKWVAAMVSGVVLYAPWLAMIAGELVQRTAGKVAAEADPARSLLGFIGEYLSTAMIGYNITGPAVVLTAGVATLLILLGLISLRRQAELLLFYLAVPLAGGLLLNQVFPFNAFPRLLAYAAPAAYLLIAASLVRFWRYRSLGLAATVIALAGLMVPFPKLYTERRYPGEDYRPIIARIDEFAMPRDFVVLDFPWQAGYLGVYSRSNVKWWLAPGSAWANHPSQMRHDLDQLLQEHPRLWYVAEVGLGNVRGRNIEGYLIDHAHLALDQWHGTTRLLLFGTGNAGPIQTLDVSFGEHIWLTGIAWPGSAVAGDVLPVRLKWQASGSVNRRLKIFLHLLDTTGQIVAQHDTEPVAGLRPTSTWRAGEHISDRLGLLIPKDLSAGRYQVEIGLYDLTTGRRRPVSQAGVFADSRSLMYPVTIQN